MVVSVGYAVGPVVGVVEGEGSGVTDGVGADVAVGVGVGGGGGQLFALFWVHIVQIVQTPAPSILLPIDLL